MTCKDKRLLMAYFYGELGPEEAEEVSVHVVSCDDCRAELGGFQELGVGAPEPGEVPYPSLEESRLIFSSIKRQVLGRKTPAKTLAKGAWLWGGVGLALAGALGGYSLSRRPAPPVRAEATPTPVKTADLPPAKLRGETPSPLIKAPPSLDFPDVPPPSDLIQDERLAQAIRLIEENKVAEGRVILGSLRSEGAGDHWVSLYFGVALALEGRHDEARPEFERAERDAPQGSAARDLARRYLSQASSGPFLKSTVSP